MISVPPQAFLPNARQAPHATPVPATPEVPFSARHPRLRVSVLPDACPNDVQLEYQALPGSLLGGPFTLRSMSRPDLQVVTSGTLQALHLKYLKQGYLHQPALKLLIDQMGGHLLHGQNRMGILVQHPDVGDNICRAVLGVMNRLAQTEQNARDAHEPDRPGTPPPGGTVALSS